MDVGAIIVTCNSAEHIMSTLDSVLLELRGLEHRVVIVDNASTDGTSELLGGLADERIKIIANGTNIGFGAAVNQAARILGSARFLLLVNPDLRLEKGAVRAMLTHMEQQPSCAAAGPAMLDRNGRTVASAFGYPSVGTELLKLCGIAKWIPSWARRLAQRFGGRLLGRTVRSYLSCAGADRIPETFDWLSGACMLIRRDALAGGPVFDERFFLYYEDVDLCKRLSARGWSIDLVPAARAVHLCHGSTGGVMNAFCLCQDTRSMFLYFARHGKRADILLLAVLAIPTAIAAALLTPIAMALRPKSVHPCERLAACCFLLTESLAAICRRLPAVSAGSLALPAGNPSSPRAEGEGRGEGAGKGARQAPSPLRTRLEPGDLPTHPTVSIIMPVRNERAFVGSAVSDLLAQDYERVIQILVVDGCSTDGTRDILDRLAASDSRLRILDNPRKRVGAALNLGIGQAVGEVIVRADCHARYAPDYVRRCVECLQRTGAANVGGPALPMAAPRTMQRAIAAAHTSWFGIGVARFRRPGYEGPADTVWPGAFLGSALKEVGPFREELDRTEDVDMNSRLRAAGYNIYISPSIRVWYAPRGSLCALCRQNFSNGRGVIQTLSINPGAVRLRHLAPLAFLLVLAAAGISSAAAPAGLTALLMVLTVYLVPLAAACLSSARRYGLRAGLLMPIVLPCIHISYGVGSLAGLCLILKKGPARICKTLSS